jgi:sugar lactone lactonase YvrE
MYYVDSPTHTIDSFDYESQSGKISNRRVVVRIPDGYGVADGIWLDENGKIWAAHFRGGCVRCWDPITGRLIETVEVPGAKMVTACTFGGTNLDELYITTASINLDEKGLLEQPCAGFLFRVSAGVRGIPAFAWDA